MIYDNVKHLEKAINKSDFRVVMVDKNILILKNFQAIYYEVTKLLIEIIKNKISNQS